MNKAGDITYKGGELYEEGNASDYGRCRPSIALMAIPVVAGASASSPYRHKEHGFSLTRRAVLASIVALAILSTTISLLLQKCSTLQTAPTSGFLLKLAVVHVEQRVFVVTAPNGYYANAVSASCIAVAAAVRGSILRTVQPADTSIRNHATEIEIQK